MGTTVTSLLVTDNFNFNPASRPYANAVTANGQLLIGSSVAPNIRVGTLGSSDSSITWTVGNGTITGQVSGGTTVGKTITGNTGGPLSPTAGNWNILGTVAPAGTNPVNTAGSGSTLVVNIQRSQAVASTNATNVGLAAFNSGDFSVDANGFVSIISSGFSWVDVTTATQTLVAETGYITDHTNVTYTLPASGALGDTIKIVGKLGITTIAQNANQQILISSSSSTVGAGGSVAGTNVGDCIELVCITSGASTVWRAANLVGNWTVT